MPDSMRFISPSEERMFTRSLEKTICGTKHWMWQYANLHTVSKDSLALWGSTTLCVQTDAKQSGQVWGVSDRSDPIRFAAKSLMSQWPMQEYGACSRCFRAKHRRRYRSDTAHVYHKGEIRRSLNCIVGNKGSGCSSYLAFRPICLNKMVPGFQLFLYEKKSVAAATAA